MIRSDCKSIANSKPQKRFSSLSLPGQARIGFNRVLCSSYSVHRLLFTGERSPFTFRRLLSAVLFLSTSLPFWLWKSKLQILKLRSPVIAHLGLLVFQFLSLLVSWSFPFDWKSILPLSHPSIKLIQFVYRTGSLSALFIDSWSSLKILQLSWINFRRNAQFEKHPIAVQW